MTNSTQSIESIDLQIKELQEQKRRLIEEQQIKDKKIYNIDEILTAANQRLHKVLIDAGIAECDVLSLTSNQTGLQDEHAMIKLDVVSSDGAVVLGRFFSSAYIHRVVNEIVDNALVLEEVNRRFKSLLKADRRVSRNSIRLVTEREQLEVDLFLREIGIFDVKVNVSLDLDDYEELYVRSKEDSNAFVEIRGLDLSAFFGYEKENVTVEELADVLADIDDTYKNFSVRAY